MPVSEVRRFAVASIVCAGLGVVVLKAADEGAIDRRLIRRELQQSGPAALERRLGPDYTFFHTNQTPEPWPEIWMAPTRQEPGGRPYQIGGPWSSDVGDYSTTQAQVLYTGDDDTFSVDRVNVLAWSNGCFIERPEPPWWGGFRPEPAWANWNTTAKNNLGVPVAIARGMGTWANCGVVVFSSGFIATAGTATASGTGPALRLPRGKIPTAISVTPKNEFALIAVTDVKRKIGQVAVVALQGGNDPNFVHDWAEAYPCAPNVGWLSNMKLLGFITLPGIEFPSSIVAVGNHEGARLVGPDGNQTMLSRFNLAQQSSRDSFRTGANAEYASTAGIAVVASRLENKVAFIDLEPLFRRVFTLYFTTAENFRKTRNLGPQPAQWPCTFGADPSWRPRVIKITNVAEPTAVLASMSGGDNARAWIASADGTVGVYTLGGLAGAGTARADGIQRIAETHVGRNPTCLAYQKLSRDTIIAVSRGDREIAWIQTDASTARVIRRLRDARMVDPVFVEMADTHGIETSLITVTDFKGRQLINYRFSSVVFASQGGATFGLGLDGNAEIECGGVMNFPGMPFCISGTNVN